MENSPRCPTCGRPLAGEALHDLCPECLLRAGLVASTQPARGKVPRFEPPTPAELAPLFPQLEILALVGQGGMGAVYRARQPNLDRTVALKILPSQDGRDPGFTERFNREARALGRLSHPNIVAVHDFGVAGGYHYFVMEFVDGVTLRHLLTTAKTTPREALAIVPQICDALQFAHDRGIVHRDIKPENILIDRSGAVKIADFGLAKIVGGEIAELGITGEHDVMGTPHYMAPEQVERPLDVDHRADIYSLGVVFYQMLTGELPMGRFAPPSRKVRIDVRLDEIVLRALEKEPERRYQQASGLKSEVETVSTSAGADPASPARDETDRSSAQTPGRSAGEGWKTRWLILAAVWLIAGGFLWLQARAVNRYLDTAGGLGLRGAPAAGTPLRQIYPAFASDAQMWVQHAIDLVEHGEIRLRTSHVDNAPHGREVHLNSGWAWCLVGAGKLHQAFTGLPFPLAVERATLWLNPVVMFGFIVLLSAAAARYFGVIAGVVVAIAMACDRRLFEGFFPSYVDHHGLLIVGVFALVLGAVRMGGAWWQDKGGDSVVPDSPATARRGAVVSALGGVFGMWVSAGTTLPAIVLVAVAGWAVMLIHGRTAVTRGARFDAGSWRRWGQVGAAGSFCAYLFEYFPSHLGFRLEANHPIYALAWLGAGELVAQFGERWLAPQTAAGAASRRWIWPAIAVALPPFALLVGGVKVFMPADPFMRHLHRDYVSEFFPLWQTLRSFDVRSVFETLQVGTLPVLAAIVTLCTRRGRNSALLWFAMFVTAGLTLMAWWQARWLLNVVGASISLLIVLLAHWTAPLRPIVRWVLPLVILAQVFVPEAVLRYAGTSEDVVGRRVSPRDAAGALSRDIAAALRASQPTGDIVLLSSPNSSTTISYYGRFKTLGTLFWENRDGLHAAASILGADDEAEAERLIRSHGVTHLAIVSDENFITPYYRLLHPEVEKADARNCFGFRLMRKTIAPDWLEPVPYEMPPDLKALKTEVALYKVRRSST